MPTEPVSDPARPPRVPGYDTGRLLGFGSTGEVWAGVDSQTGNPVALKVLRGGADGPQAWRESAVLRRIDHPHVVRLIDVVEGDSGLVLVLERAAGGSLAALVGARGGLDPGEVVTVLTPLAGALAELHERGLVHGDVSPGNVLFADDGRPLLGDLGVASLLGVPGDAHGTPGYADPAAVTGTAPTPAGDMHALAAVGWYALTGQTPPPRDQRPPLLPTVPGTPAALAALVESGLDVRPDHRPGAVGFAAASFDAAPAVPVRLVPTDPGAAAAEVVTHRLRAAVQAPAPIRERPRRRPWWRPWGVVATAVVLVAAAAALGVALSWPSAEGVPASSVEPTPEATVAGLDPASAVAGLSQLRAQAFAEGRTEPLLSASVPSSPALAADLSLAADLTARGLLLDGLAFAVGPVEVIEADDGHARVRVVVTTGAHRQLRVSDGAVVAEVPASEPVTSELRLQVVDGAWRVAEVLPAT